MELGYNQRWRGNVSMNRYRFLFILIPIMFFLSGCDSARKAFGNKKLAPDEFLVYSRPPLSQPPDYGLRPPAQRSQVEKTSPVNQAKLAILKQVKAKNRVSAKKGLSSIGTESFLKSAGADKINPKIRKIINQETSIFSEEDQRFVDRLIFWVDDKPFEGSIIDPNAEKRRIREAQALGKDINKGKTNHIIRKRGKKGLLEF